MANYKHILAATAFHSETLPIVTKAVELARQYQAQLSVVSVVPNVPYYMASGLSSVSDIELQLQADTQKKLDNLQSRFDMPMSCYLARGVPKTEIVNLAKKIGADLIIIGSHGKHGVQLLLGSTASGVAHGAACDVLLLREKT